MPGFVNRFRSRTSNEPGFTPPGWYWCIDNVSVREDLQGQGIGRQLVQAIEDQLASLHLDLNGYVLWFNPDNPNAASFWPHLGFQPLWTTYQRMQSRPIGAKLTKRSVVPYNY